MIPFWILQFSFNWCSVVLLSIQLSVLLADLYYVWLRHICVDCLLWIHMLQPWEQILGKIMQNFHHVLQLANICSMQFCELLYRFLAVWNDWDLFLWIAIQVSGSVEWLGSVFVNCYTGFWQSGMIGICFWGCKRRKELITMQNIMVNNKVVECQIMFWSCTR